MRRMATSLLTVAFLAAACGDDSARTTGSDPSEVPGDSGDGPLATAGPADGSDEALISGTMVISDRCVLLDERGEDVLLVWPRDRVEWDADTNAVRFQGPDDQVIELRDGDQITMGGGGSSTREGGLSRADFLESIDWVQQPHESCVVDTRWFVGELLDPA